MKYSLTFALVFISLLLCRFAHAQNEDFRYRRELRGVSDSWHRLELPDVLFWKAKTDLSDLRIIGLKEGGDTLSVPYLLQVMKEREQQEEVPFKMLNRSRQGSRYFYTLEVPSSEEVNRIRLFFRENNFDRHVQLEGSQQPGEWFTILEDYRIVSISNASTDYTFTSLHLPLSKYRYYRLSFSAEEEPVLLSAQMRVDKRMPGRYRTYTLQDSRLREEKERKRTLMDLQLPSRLPLSQVRLSIRDTIDYYRPLSIQVLIDSAHTTKGWEYVYKTVTSGILSSLEESVFHFPLTHAERLRVIIDNGDNAPLKIGDVTVKGNVHEIRARFPQADAYYLLYGNEKAERPHYDLENFVDKIPAALSELEVAEEQPIEQQEPVLASPLFQDQRWLWGIMLLMIVVLGWFSLKMIRKA